MKYRVSKDKWYPWLIVIALGLMSAGTTGTYSIIAGSFVSPICEDLSFDYTAFSFYFTAVLIGLSAALPFMGKVLPKIVGTAWHVGIELVLLAAGAAMAFYTEIWMFIVSAFIIGLCFSCTTGVCMSDVIDQWFKQSAGLAIGLAWAVNSLCTLILSPSIACAIEILGWRCAMIAMAGISALLVLPSTALVIRFSPKDKGLSPWGSSEDSSANHPPSNPLPHRNMEGVSLKQALMSPALWLCFAFLCAVQITCCMNQLFPTYAIEVGLGPLVGGLMVSSASLFDIFLNPLVGKTIDKIGSTRAIAAWTAVSIASFFLLWIGSKNPTTVIFAAGINDVMFAVSGTALPMLVLSIFGSQDYSRILSLVCSVGYLVGAFGMPIMMKVYEFAGTFSGVFAFCIALDVCIATLATLAFKARRTPPCSSTHD